jgi:hypothetical protein
MTMRQRAGALVYDWPRFVLAMRGNWTRMRNRDEVVTMDARGARCEWSYTSDLHLSKGISILLCLADAAGAS